MNNCFVTWIDENGKDHTTKMCADMTLALQEARKEAARRSLKITSATGCQLMKDERDAL